jgi:phospholipid:diacylglycerol acyltransferase
LIDNFHSWGVDPEAAFHPQRWVNLPKKWTNVLESPLPDAPDMTVYCLYGIGKPTERGFYYTNSSQRVSQSAKLPNGQDGPSIPYQIDTSKNFPEVNLNGGVQEGDGDGTVPLISMGYMCYDGWRNYPGLNPSRMRTVVREYPHNPVSLVLNPRGVPTTADHVDIMGNFEMIADVLEIISGGEVAERITSQLPEFSSKIRLRSTLRD